MSPAPNSTTQNPLDILVVEDHLDAAETLARLLRIFGHAVRIARTGPAALEMCSAVRPDVVLLDIALPGMDGYQVAERLRERQECQQIAICAVTGFSFTEGEKERLSRSGFNHCFVKPVDVDELTRVFEHIVPAAR